MSLEVPAGAAGSRADRFAADAAGLSRAQVQRLIGQGRLTLDGRPIRANTPLPAGGRLELDVPEVRPLEVKAEAIPLEIVYEDDDLLVVDKPAGLVTHPAPGHADGTLVNALLGRDGGYGAIAGIARPGIVHRLDRDTSGLLMVAKNDQAQATLMAALKARRVKKTYLALVAGSPAASQGRIEAPIGRDPVHRTRMAIVADGRQATSGYRVRERLAGWTLLELDLLTGRTHQLRVHLASIGLPIAGDRVYASGPARRGPAGLERMFLHAWRLELAAPSGERHLRLVAPLPTALETVLDDLRVAHGVGVR
ncbi:MAG TPA: RluA family pseudouridine synthase [Candidatus Limnocylindrales bacterium]|nr:RluA family pseudouridine synthase [Candidatus Limnocylindrales bacterium]